MVAIKGFHHLTAGVGGAQEDVSFYVKLLGQKLVKKTVLFDGKDPIYHLYYGNPDGEPGTLVTSFPFRQKGVKARAGSGQVRVINYSVPRDSLGFWRARFSAMGVAHDDAVTERFGEKRQRFQHPCGIEFDLVETDADTRQPCTTDDIPEDVAVRGVHSVTLSLREVSESIPFMSEVLDFRYVGESGPYHRFETHTGGPGMVVEFLHEPDRHQGSTIYGEGTVHHVAFAVDSKHDQDALKTKLMGLGYIDTSESVDRNYFRSMYFKMPGGVIFEAATTDIGFAIDEEPGHFGEEFQLPPWLRERKDELLGRLEPIAV
ncbi:ring-cleaving dioxygenase [Paraburkholderia sp. Ac-20336]|uniref:ring-cleaving dioxygenase n=1 Tax=Burkholderiaceae TaxID=119060 RepID=UPI00141E7E8E|nr:MULTISPECIES: ring-cleaving dioxygenase [Burkholderiaceae]MBN3802326.1 ring-cleaving dioxygenase [Paraburkholderia sp. Ac-20336]MBN3845878.1 ring-cleaving dioxygenase [Paraburkholderia sp. Ac-20342]NIF55086.1 ring-cleaving dioxygenase [Burkholderia sp. Ax-1724]NIF77347.1 ring-cleaving dioxygenase [Paraburkholderia sp. Cy-641]